MLAAEKQGDLDALSCSEANQVVKQRSDVTRRQPPLSTPACETLRLPSPNHLPEFIYRSEPERLPWDEKRNKRSEKSRALSESERFDIHSAFAALELMMCLFASRPKTAP